MEIKFNRTVDSGDWLARFQAMHKENRAIDSGVSLEESAELERKLEAEPAVRAAAIARAKELVKEPGYPPAAAINGIARLLAAELAQDL